MYLSKILLDRTNPSVRQSLADCHDMHRSIMKAFPDVDSKNARQSHGVLYRVFPKGNEEIVYILSKEKPDFDAILTNGFICDGNRNVDELIKVFVKGTCLTFDCLLNPSKKTKNLTGKNSKRTVLKTSDERLDWLHRKAEQAGFNIEWVREDGNQTISGAHKVEQGGKIIINAYRYQGVLRITDSENFSAAFKNGIGSEKAYGLGLLLIGR